MTIGNVTGNVTANYVYASMFNPAGSGKAILIRHVYIQMDSTAVATYQTVTLRKITNASLGTMISASDIFQKNSGSNLSIADLRYAGPTVTLSGGVNSRIMSALAPGAVGSLIGYKDIVMENSEPIALLPGEGMALYQEAAGSANQKVRLLVEWDEQNITTNPLVPKDEYMLSTPVVGVAAAANYVYASMFNPTSSNKTAIIKRIAIEVDCSAAAVYTNNIAIRRITAASVGTLITNTDIPKKYNSSNTSLMEIRSTGPTVTFAGTVDSRIALVTPCGAADQFIGHKEYVFDTAEEKIILKQGEGLALYTEAAGNANQKVRMFVEWSEVANTSTPAAQNESIITYPPVAVAATANYVYQSFYNPVGSGKVAIVKRIEMRVDAIGAAAYQPISIRKITAASLGTLVTQANVPKKQSSTANTLMELRYAGPTVTFLGTGNSTILNVIGAGAIGQLRSRREYVLNDHEKIILQPGEGIAMISEAAGSANQSVKFSIEWEEESLASTPPPQNEYLLNIGEMTGSATANYNYTAFFNPANSNKTAIIHRLYIGIDAAAAAVYTPFSLRRINASSGGLLINASDINKKNNASNLSSMNIRYNGPAITFLGTVNSRLESVLSPGIVGSSTAPQSSGSQEIYLDDEDFILRPGEGVVLYSEGAGSANLRINLFADWQEVPSNQTINMTGDRIISIGPVSGNLTSGYVYSTLFNPANSNRNYIFKRIGVRGDRFGAMSAPGYVPLSVRKISSSTGGALITTSEIPVKNTLAPNSTTEIRYGGPTVNYLGGTEAHIYTTTVPGVAGQNYGNMETYFILGDELVLRPGEGLALYQESNAGDANVTYRMDLVWNESIADSVLPSIFFNSNTTATGLYSGNWVYASVNASDNRQLNTTFIRLYNSTYALINSTNSTNILITSINFTNLVDGTYYLNATTNDSASNYNWTETRTIILDTTPPNMTGVLPANNSNYQFFDTIGIAVNSTDLNSVNRVWANITLPNQTYTLANLSLAVGNKYNSSFVVPVVSGRYNITYYANDSTGNSAISSGYFNAVDSTPPSPFNLTTPQNNTLTSNLLPVFSWQQTTEPEFKNYTLLISQSPTFAAIDYSYTTTQITNTTYPLTVSLNNNSKYYWRVIAYDVSGNSRNSTFDYIYSTDVVTPTVGLNTPSNLGFATSSNVLFNYTPNDTNLVNCSLYGNFSGLFSYDQINTTPISNQPNYFSKVLSDGTYLWNVRCYDAAGNNGFALSNYTVNVDTQPPVISLGSPQNNTRINATNNITFYYNVTDAMTGVSSCSLVINNIILASNNVISEGISQNLTAYLNNGLYNWSINCTDNNGFIGSSYTNNLSIKIPIYPAVTLIQPINNTGDNDGNVILNYTVTGGTTINCSLILNGVPNLTSNAVNISSIQSFNLTGLATGRYNWSISCINEEGNSNAGNVSINYFDVILSTGFAGSTTDFSTVNTGNISALTIDNPGYGKIVYIPNINLSNGANLNSLINIGNNIISVDTITEPRLNFSATLTMSGLPYTENPAIYSDGLVCLDCSVVSYNSGTLIFGVTHFTSYTTGLNANMTIWDESDPQGGSILKHMNNSVKFFANYTNKTSGTPITAAVCNISFNGTPGNSALMTYNATSHLYEYNRSFSNFGYYIWNVSCNGSSQRYERLFTSDSITIYSDAIVSIITMNPASSINVSKNNLFNYTVNITCVSGYCGNLTATLDPSSWWDSNWKYRRQINLTMSSGATPKNYQLRMILNSSNVGANWNWSNECIGSNDSRIKFVNGSDALELGYWVEGCSAAGQNMTVWVNVDQNITTSNYSIYLYYGNAGATGNSNGTKTFDLFDDFSGDLSKWNVHIANGVYPRIENGVMVAGGGITSGNYGHNVLGSDATYNSFKDGIIEGNVYLNDTNSIGEVGFRGNYGSNTGYKSRMDARAGQGLSHLLPPYSGWNFITGCTATGTAVSASQWLNMKIIVSGNNFNISVGTQSLTCTDSTYSSAGEISLQNHYGTATMYDNIRVRKYSAIVPTYMIGSEQLTGQKDIIPMNSGTPFYTINNNPMNYTNASCLTGMNAGDSCVLTWNVNSTGNLNTLWFFYAFVNGTAIFSQSNLTNITIINDTIAPRITNAVLNTTIINQSESVSLNVTINDETQILSTAATLKYPNGTLMNYTLSQYAGNVWRLVFTNTNATGIYNFTNIIAIDQGQNVNNTYYNALIFNVTLSPPGTFNLSLPINNTESSNLLPSLSWQQTNETTFANYTILISDSPTFDIVRFTYAISTITNTSKVLDYALDANKIYYWKVVAYDIFGSYTNSTQTFVYITDLVNPTVALNTPASNSYSLTHNIKLNYTPDDANTLSSCSIYGNFSGSWALNQTNNSIIKTQFNYFDIILADGAYLWNVKCTDRAGNSGFAPANYTIKIDTTPPYIQLISPSNNTFENNTNNEIFIVNATDALSNIGSCELIIDNVSEQTRAGITNGILFNFTNLILNGNHTWSVNCTDTNGFKGASSTYNLNVNVTDRDPPLITLNYPSPSYYLSAQNVMFNYTPQDATGLLNCSIYMDGILNKTNYGSNLTNLVPNYFNITSISEGIHNWSITCYDNGTLKNKGISAIYNFVIDLTNPTLSLSTPSNGSIFNYSFITFNYMPNDINLYNCTLYGNFGGIFAADQTNTTPLSGQPNFFSRVISDGTYLWNVLCTDKSGRSSFANSNYTISIDTTAPYYSSNISSPSTPAAYGSSSFYEYNITWNDNFGVNRVLFENNFTGIWQNITVGSSVGNIYSINFTGLSAGNYGYGWYAYDSQNNQNYTSLYSYNVNSASSSVTLLLNGTNGNISIKEGSSINISSVLSTPNSGYIEVYIEGTLINNGTSPISNITLFSYPGLYNITAYYPATQNYLSTAQTYFVRVNDTTPPNVTLIFPSNNSVIGSSTVTFQYAVQDASNISSCSLYINNTLNQTSGSVLRNITQTFSADFVDGNYSWKIGCSDIYGNSANSSVLNFTERQTTNMTIVVSTLNFTHQQGEPVLITSTTKDSFGNPLNAYVGTGIIYSNNTIITIPWFNGSWIYRMGINITELNNTNLTNYQINISINTSGLILSGKMLSDCSDIRLADSTAKEIPYWIENGCNSSDTRIWIKTNLSAGLTRTIYIYYGNAAATSNSNSSNVFDYYDDGNQTGSWSVVGTAGQSSVQGLPAPSYYATSVNGNYMYRNASLTTNSIVEFNVRSDGLGNFYFLTDSYGAGQHFRAETRVGNNAGVGPAASWISWSVPSQTCAVISINTWYTFKLVILSTTAQAYINGAACGGAYTFTNNGPYIGLVGDGLGATYNTWLDNIRVRKYSAQEPTSVVLSGEQKLLSWNYNSTSLIDGNFSFIFNSTNQSYGNYSIVALASAKNFYNAYNYTYFDLEPDATQPVITLITPADFQKSGVGVFNFAYVPYDYNLKNCSIYININGTFRSLSTDNAPLNNMTNYFNNISLGLGVHTWNIICYDMNGNSAFASYNYTLNVTGPDMTLSSNSIYFSNVSLTEGNSVTIYANITNAGLSDDLNPFIIQFYLGDPDLGGIQIGNNMTIFNLSLGEVKTLNTTYLLNIGVNNIFVYIDRNNSVNESDKSNNKANNSITVEMYQYYHGNITVNLLLGTSNNSAFFNVFNITNFRGNVFVADADSVFSFTDLQALGRNKNNDSVINDFTDADINMNTTGFVDSLNAVWTNGTNTPLMTGEFEITPKLTIYNVPIVYSSNNTNFTTGILWDTADDLSSNFQYDIVDKEDLVFVTSFDTAKTKNGEGYLYEIKVPARLRSYKGTTDKVALYYTIS